MYRYVVITDASSAPAFLLGGLEVLQPAENRDARELVLRCLRDPEVGLIAINDRYLVHLDTDTRARLETSILPAVIPFPDLREVAGGYGEEHVSRIIERAIGYRIRLR